MQRDGISTKLFAFLKSYWNYLLVWAILIIILVEFRSAENVFTNVLSNLSMSIFELVFICPIFIAIYLILTHSIQAGDATYASENRRALNIVLLAICTFAILLVQSHRFLLQSTPQGSDTPTYLYVSNLISEGRDFVFLFGNPRVLSYAVTSIAINFSNVFGSTWIVALMVFPLLLSIFFSFAVYWFTKAITKNTSFAILSFLLTGVSIFLIRMSYDLISNTLSMAFGILALAEYYLWITNVRRYRSGLILAASLLSLSLLSNQFFWLFIMLILIIVYLVERLGSTKSHLKSMLLVTLPSILLFAIQNVLADLLVKLIPQQFYEMVVTPGISAFAWPFTAGNASVFSLPQQWDSFAALESPFLILLAALGILVVGFRIKEQNVMVLAWCIAPFLMLLATGFSDSYRLIIVFPIGIVAAYGIWLFLDTQTNGKSNSAIIRKWIKITVGILIILLIVGSAYSRSVISSETYYPGSVAISELDAIRNRFGFENSSIVILVSADTQSNLNSLQYARAITGSYVYVGQFTDFIDNRSFIWDNSEVELSVSNFKTVLMPLALYHPTSLEESIGRLVAPGVMAINLDEGFNLGNDILQSSEFKITNFTAQPYLLTNSLNHSLSYPNGTFLLWISGHLQSEGFATYEIKLNGSSIANASELYVSVKTNLYNLMGIIEIWYTDNTAQGIYLTNSTRNQFVMYDMSINPNHQIEKVRLALWNYDNSSAAQSPEFMQLRWIALL